MPVEVHHDGSQVGAPRGATTEGEGIEVADADVGAALDELLSERSALTAWLTGDG